MTITINKEFNKLGLNDWLENSDPFYSSRIKSIKEEADKYKDNRIILFSDFRESLNLMMNYFDERPIFSIENNMSIKQRSQTINDFKKSKNGILFLTYKIGSCGLNLQFADTVFLTDLTFKHDDHMQAIARINRTGQMAEKINIVKFASNTGIENSILMKQESKLTVSNELKEGPSKSKISTIKMDEAIEFVDLKENLESLNNLNLLYNLKKIN